VTPAAEVAVPMCACTHVHACLCAWALHMLDTCRVMPHAESICLHPRLCGLVLCIFPYLGMCVTCLCVDLSVCARLHCAQQYTESYRHPTYTAACLLRCMSVCLFVLVCGHNACSLASSFTPLSQQRANTCSCKLLACCVRDVGVRCFAADMHRTVGRRGIV
jgi:hypothetical protein